MKKLLLPICLLLGIFATNLNAQDSDNKKSPHGFMVGINFINHEYALTDKFGNTDAYTQALELGYVRKLSSNFNLLFPLQLGGATFPKDDSNLGSKEFFGSLDGLAQALLFKRSYLFSPYAVAGLGFEGRFDRSDDFFGIAIPLGVGLDLNVTKNTSIGVRGEYRLGVSDYDDNIQLNFGLSTNFGADAKKEKKSDLDGDGLDDTVDKCPAEAGPIALGGCPDNDNDGIANNEDGCPNDAGPAENNGCPILDQDGDGIADADDKCPTEAGSAQMQGCPDSDGDGVADVEDSCPDKAGKAELSGCPDSDNDGFADNKDDCPTVAGTLGGCPDTDSDGIADSSDNCPKVAGPKSNNGCPIIKEEDKKVLDFAAQNIQFETASSVLKAESKTILDQIADILKNYPSHSLSISGHTDSIGSAESNLKLSQKRAKSCYEYLISKGLTSSRMSHAGYGETQPIADNKFKAGRKQNRRVVFNIYVPK